MAFLEALRESNGKIIAKLTQPAQYNGNKESKILQSSNSERENGINNECVYRSVVKHASL